MINQRLDEQIDQKVDAYRNNPQQLAASYQKNQQLVDLLALQKLKSQQDAVARDMQMKAQNDPSTIKQQREQEMFQRTKQDMIKQTQGIMQNRQANQQKNLQRLMKTPQRPQPQRPQPQGGLPAMMSKRPTPKMSGGGIVGFAPGGSTDLEKPLTLEEKINIILNRTDLNEGQKSSLIAQIRAQEPSSVLPYQTTVPVGRVSSARMPGVRGLIPAGFETNTLDVLAETRPQIAPNRPKAVLPKPPVLPQTPNYPNQAPVGGATPPVLPQTPNYPNQAPVGGAIPSMPPLPQAADLPQPELPSSDLSQYNTGIGGGSPMAALQQGLGIADLYTKRAEKDERLGSLISKLEALEGDFNRKDEANDRFRASLAAASGSRNITDFAKQYVGTSQSMELAQKAARRARLGEVIAAEQKRIESDNELSRQGLSLGQEMFAQASQDRRTAQTNAAGMRNTDVMAALDLSKLALDKLKLDKDVALKLKDQALEESRQAIDRAQNEEMTKTRRSNDLTIALGNIDKVREKYYKTVYEESGISLLKMQAMNLTGKEKEEKEQEIRRQEQIVSLAVEAALNADGLIERERQLFKAWSDVTGLAISDDTVRR